MVWLPHNFRKDYGDDREEARTQMTLRTKYSPEVCVHPKYSKMSHYLPLLQGILDNHTRTNVAGVTRESV